VARRNVLYCALAAMIGLLACSKDTPATQLLVSLNADANVAAQLVSVRVFTYDVENSDESRPAGEHVFTLAKGAPLDGQVSFPFSFGISKQSEDRLRIVIKGYAAADPSAPPVIEQKVITAFQANQRLGVTLFLPDACYGKAVECTGLQQTCVLVAQTQAQCTSTPSVFGVPFVPGEELPDASTHVDAGMSDAPRDRDAASDRDARPADQPVSRPDDAGLQLPPVAMKLVKAQISADGNDIFHGVTHDSTGNIYAVGSTTPTPLYLDTAFVVAKYSQYGVLDPGFGNGGYAVVNVVEGGSSEEVARAVVVRDDGKIVVAGQAEHRLSPGDAGTSFGGGDTDLVLARLLSDGTLDTSFGANGVVRHDVGTGYAAELVPGLGFKIITNRDVLASMVQAPDGKLVIHMDTASLASQDDSDYALVRLDEDGQLDTSFGGSGIVRTDFSKTRSSADTGLVLADGSFIGTGSTYSNVLSSVQITLPVLYKVSANGSPDAQFATRDPVTVPGVFHDFCRADKKAFLLRGAATQGSRLVGIGSGPALGTATDTDWMWVRFHADGTQDTTFNTGSTIQRASAYTDEGNALIALPDSRLLGVGYGRKTPFLPLPDAGVPPADGMIGVLRENGEPDTNFAVGGYRLYDLGGASDNLFAVELSPDKRSVAAVGVGRTSADGPANAILLVLPAP
jgi:uncharacterized delta-60 repeat protein